MGTWSPLEPKLHPSMRRSPGPRRLTSCEGTGSFGYLESFPPSRIARSFMCRWNWSCTCSYLSQHLLLPINLRAATRLERTCGLTDCRAFKRHPSGLAARRAFQAPNSKYLRVGSPQGISSSQCISRTKWLESTCGLGSPQGISSTKWLGCTCGLAARRAFQAPNGWDVPAGWQPTGHFKDQMGCMGVGSPQGISRTKWLESTCGLAARKAC